MEIGTGWYTHSWYEPTHPEYRAALDTLDEHRIDARGLCQSCDRIGPCVDREAAMRVFNDFLWMPIRRPGATNPELLSAQRVA